MSARTHRLGGWLLGCCIVAASLSAQEQPAQESEPAGAAQIVPSPAGEAQPPAPESASPVAVAGLRYQWIDKQVYRFAFEKRITVKRDGAENRVTKFTGVLVFFIDKIEDDGTALATMKLDSPGITLPEFLQYDNDEDEPASDEVTRARMKPAIETALNATTWLVRLSPEGHIRVLRREPASYDEWVLKMRRAAKWFKKHVQIAETLTTEHLMIGPGTQDAELLVAASRPVRAEPVNPKSLEALRPVRAIRPAAKRKDARLELSVTRAYVDGVAEGSKVRIPKLSAEDVPVVAVLGPLKNIKGHAVFDAKMGMLDSLSEAFQAQSTMQTAPRRGPPQKMDQTVEVIYRLKRLAPALRTDAPPAAPAP